MARPRSLPKDGLDKDGSGEDGLDAAPTPESLGVWKPTREQVLSAYNSRMADVIAPNLRAVLCGINPSLYSAAVGHHFARPGNRFWPALYGGGITPRLWSPFEDDRLPELGYGITNMCWRATARADEVDAEEFRRGRRTLARKLTRYRPRVLAILGVMAYRAAFDIKGKIAIGPQPQTIARVPIYVLPNPSGLNAHYQLPELSVAYGRFREWCESQPA